MAANTGDEPHIDLPSAFAMLPFQMHMFTDLVSSAPDGLLVIGKATDDHSDRAILISSTGRAMGMDRVLLSLLSLYTDPKMLVLVINVNEQDLGLLTEELGGFSAHHPPVAITTEQSSTDRQDLYLRGGLFSFTADETCLPVNDANDRAAGVIFVTSRILAVDMLTQRIPMKKITGLVVANAHKVTPLTPEAFILRLYRHENREGFVKAVTDNAHGFVSEYNTVEKVRRSFLSVLAAVT